MAKEASGPTATPRPSPVWPATRGLEESQASEGRNGLDGRKLAQTVSRTQTDNVSGSCRTGEHDSQCAALLGKAGRPIPNTSEYVRIRADTLPKVPPPVGSFFTGQMLREKSQRPRAQTNHGTPQQQEALSLRQLTCRSGPSEDIMLRQDLRLRAFRHCPECRMPC